MGYNRIRSCFTLLSHTVLVMSACLLIIKLDYSGENMNILHRLNKTLPVSASHRAAVASSSDS